MKSSPARFDWITYAELGKQISDFRRVLHKYNVEKGSKVSEQRSLFILLIRMDSVLMLVFIL